MKNSQNQNSPNVQKDAVQHKSPTFFIQLGLVFALLLAYLAIELKTYSTPIDDDVIVFKKTFEEEEPPVIIEKPEPQPVKQQPPVDMGKVETIDNNSAKEETNLVSTETGITDKIDPYDFSQIKNKDVEEKIDETDVPFVKIEHSPVYPGCQGTQEELKKCFSEKVNKYVNSNFDVSVAEGLPFEGKQKIQVQFTIDKEGKIADIKVRGPHKALENEAVRVVKKLPQMIPGKQRTKPVNVTFYLPITVSIQN